MTPQERARDKRLQKSYRWSLVQINALDEHQEHKCGICGRLPKNMPLNVDHKHFKIKVERGEMQSGSSDSGKWVASTTIQNLPIWIASTTVQGQPLSAWAKTKAAAVSALREMALPRSVRGLLCPGRHRGCNRLLGRIDSIEWLEKALQYLKDPPATQLRKKEKSV